MFWNKKSEVFIFIPGQKIVFTATVFTGPESFSFYKLQEGVVENVKGKLVKISGVWFRAYDVDVEAVLS